MNFSTFGQKFVNNCGIVQLMDDLGRALAQPGMIMLGGGNPSHIPEVQDYFRQRMAHILDSASDFEQLIGNYGPPAGDNLFCQSLADFLNRHYQWGVTAENIALTTGSQTAFFALFNLFAGDFPDGSRKKILLPLAPEYIGYEDVGIQPDIFTAYRPHIEFLDNRLFKYHVDFEQLQMTPEIGAIAVSRPTNPTGNVLNETEMHQLSEIAKQHHIPFIVDNAYGLPFPNLIFEEAHPHWEPHIVMCMSLSKLGLPGTRTGIVIADRPVIKALTAMNAVMSLAPSSFGAVLAVEAIQNDEILRLSREVVRPHYEQKAHQVVDWLRTALDGVDFYIHKPEGALFLWLWFKDIPLHSQELYERLKARQVLIVPGHHFFPGLAGEWRHKGECLRLNYAQPAGVVQQGIAIIAEEVKKAYKEVESSKYFRVP